jgi:hypothetical protein
MGNPEPVDVLHREGRGPLPRRVVVGVISVLLVAGLVVFLVDRDVRGREERALAACADEARTEVARAYAPVVSAFGYVRPVLDNGPRGQLRRGMYTMVSDAASGADQRLAAVRRQCRDIDVLWAHPDLRDRRDACLAGLDEHAAFLRSVARHGHAVSRPWPAPRC